MLELLHTDVSGRGDKDDQVRLAGEMRIGEKAGPLGCRQALFDLQ